MSPGGPRSRARLSPPRKTREGDKCECARAASAPTRSRRASEPPLSCTSRPSFREETRLARGCAFASLSARDTPARAVVGADAVNTQKETNAGVDDEERGSYLWWVCIHSAHFTQINR
jgi:hypothetical protein